MSGHKLGLIDNFRIDEATNCWNWIRCKNPDGYGMMTHLGRPIPVHRLVAHLYLGLNLGQKGMQVLHRCDNPSCINPKHLFIGTQLENMRDCYAKKRSASQRRGNVCMKGHPLEGYNEGIDFRGDRYCKLCKKLHLREWRRRKSNITNIPLETPVK